MRCPRIPLEDPGCGRWISRASRLMGSGLAAAVLLAAGLGFIATGAEAQTLNGISCEDVKGNGVAAQDPSDRGFTNPVVGTPLALPPRSGFDYLGAWVWVRNDGANGCGTELNDLYLCLDVAGRWGDADGDGVRDAQGGLCGDPAINPGSDGPLGELPLSRNEALTFFVDRDCDGFADLQLEVAGMAGGSPTLVVTADEYTGMQGTDLGGEGVTFEYSDKDNTAYTTCPTEVNTQVLIRVPNWNSFFAYAGPPNISPAVFSYDVNGGNRVDGPPEDNVRGSVDVALPDLSISKDPDLALCEGQQDNLTITVTNTGNVSVSDIIVTDELPVGWSSCGVISGGVTVQQVGTTLTFSSFDLEPCEVKEIVFCIEAGAECSNGPNTASAEGAHLADCLDGGGRGVGPVTASSQLTCLPDPCIEIRCDVNPTQVCAGDDYTVEVWGMNCSTGPEDITLWIDGESQFFAGVAAGAEVHFDWTFTAPVDCPAGTVTNHLTRAVATNECNPDPGVEAECPVSVTCLPQPCVEIVCDVDKPEVCPGEEYTVTATATNCSDGPEDIVIYIDGLPRAAKASALDAQGAQTYATTENSKLFEDVPAGEKVTYEVIFTAPGNCEAGSTIPHNTRAVATNQCNPDPGVMDECQTAVTCLPEPCVELKCSVDNPTVCPGTEYTVTATAVNCSDGVEDITLYIDSESKVFEDVAVGATVEFMWTFTAPLECEAGSQWVHNTRAVATNECNPEPGVIETCDVTITCLPEPCVKLVCDVDPGAVCPDNPYEVSATATNCSDGVEDITLWIDGESKLFEDVAVDASVEFTWTFTAPADCEPGQEIQHITRAVATNICDPDGIEEICPVVVTCLPEPCVEVTIDAPAEGCDGDLVEIVAEALNCSKGIEDITLVIYDPTGAVLCEKTFEDVDSGAKVELSCESILECDPGEKLVYSADASAVNDCGKAESGKVDAAVTCQIPEIDVEKEGPVSVIDDQVYTYTITLKNPGPVDLDNVTVTDVICDYVRYEGNASPAADSEPAIGAVGGTVEWSSLTLGVGEALTFTFEVRADCDLFEGASIICVNVVNAEGYCGNSKAEDRDVWETQIDCPTGSCPRTVGFWGQQCAQKGNGSTKFTKAEVIQIAMAADAKSAWFDWGSGDAAFNGFCRIINPDRPMTIYKQLQRQFAALLANYGTGELQLIASNGNVIKLDLSTPIDCPGVDSKTIGELIKEVDDALINDKSDKYGYLNECVDGINNAYDIPPAPECPRDISYDRASGSTGGTDLSTNSGLGGIEGGDQGMQVGQLALYSPTPNPFNSSTRIAYAVNGGTSERVEIGIYNVAGKLVRKLVSGMESPGYHEAAWDGRSDAGVQVTPGVYFLRAFVGAERITGSRILYMP